MMNPYWELVRNPAKENLVICTSSNKYDLSRLKVQLRKIYRKDRFEVRPQVVKVNSIIAASNSNDRVSRNNDQIGQISNEESLTERTCENG
jgi:hypothetical protein